MLAPLGEVGFGDDQGIPFGYIEEVVVRRFRDLPYAVVGKGGAFPVLRVVHQPVLGEAVGNGDAFLGALFGEDSRREEKEDKTDLNHNKACEYKAEQG